MSAFVNAAAPLEADLFEPKVAKRRADVGKGEERGADIVQVAGQGGFKGVERSAGARLRLEDADAPACLRQRRRRHQAVGAGADHHRVVQALPFLICRRSGQPVRATS